MQCHLNLFHIKCEFRKINIVQIIPYLLEADGIFPTVHYQHLLYDDHRVKGISASNGTSIWKHYRILTVSRDSGELLSQS